MISNDGVGNIDHDQFFSLFETELQMFQQSLQVAGKGDLFHGAKVVLFAYDMR